MAHNLSHNTTCLNTQHSRPNAVAAYLIQEGDYAAFIDTGCYLSVPILLQVLDDKDIKRENVLYALPTKLKAGVLAVYGEEFFKQTLGDLVATSADRIKIPMDGESIKLGNRASSFY